MAKRKLTEEFETEDLTEILKQIDLFVEIHEVYRSEDLDIRIKSKGNRYEATVVYSVFEEVN